ncbi:MAG: 3',5'-cyclic-AMP phosphodiesterase [Pseudomonadota bacterium]
MTQHNQSHAYRIVQLSDSHLFANEDGKLLGMNTRESCTKVLDLIHEQNSKIDLILVTGDVTQDGSAAAYQFLEDKLKEFPAPKLWLPGNHDRVDVMPSLLIDSEDLLAPITFRLGNWLWIMLDSVIPGKVPGRLTEASLKLLADILQTTDAPYIAVCLHHHPFDLGSKWLDTVGLKNPEEFWPLLENDKRVKMVIWGHVHQEHYSQRGHITCMSVPSTCVQFKPQSQEFSVDSLLPGYRSFNVYNDGRFNSHISRVEHMTFEVDYSVKGY